MKDFVSKNNFLASMVVPTEEVETPAGLVKMRGMTAKESLSFLEKYTDIASGKPKNISSFSMGLVARCLVDENGETSYTEEQIGSLSPVILSQLLEVAMKLSGIGNEVTAKGKNSVK